MSDQTPPDSAVAVNDSKDRVLSALEQLLGQCDDDDAPALIDQVKTKLAHRYYALNAHQCRLLDLPIELLERIGEFVLHSSQADPSKHWFTRGIFPLLQASSQLRTQLQIIRKTPLTYYIMTDRPWDSGMRADVTNWRQKGFHEGPNRIVVVTPSRRYKPSTAAALAGALECAIYGGLLNPPAVYIRLKMMSGTTGEGKDREFYVCHTRAKNMLVETLDDGLRREALAPVGREESVEIWEQAKKKTRDQAP